MANYFNECYTGPFQEMSPEDFRKSICRFCKNPECDNTGFRQNPWVRRMSTQVEQLLEQPNFANPNDPAYEQVRKVDFEDAMRQAIRLEISAQKGDWEIPTAKDALQYVEEMKRRGPGNPVALNVGEGGDSEDAVPPSDLIDEVQVRPAQEQVKLPDRFVAVQPSPQKAAPEPPSKESPPQAHVSAAEQRPSPKRLNTTVPSEGIMIGGSGPAPSQGGASAPSDPWGLPSKSSKEEIIPVGGKIVLGEDPPEGER